MTQIIVYSSFLCLGIIISQVFNLSAIRNIVTPLTLICLAYIMIGVGLEFEIDKKRISSYGREYAIAAGAASIPWILVSIYFMVVFHAPWQEAFLVGRFAAPTSAGVLLAMLSAAGLGSTWVFGKARILAIFDDLDTVFFMIPLQIIIMGFQPGCITIILFIITLLAVAYRWLHRLRWPTGNFWLLAYSVIIFVASEGIKHSNLIHHLEVLVPGFVLGCVLSNTKQTAVERNTLSSDNLSWLESFFDQSVKALFMFLVGCSIPKITLGSIPLSIVLIHVLILTVLCNIGKCFPLLGYRGEVSFRERMALSVALFPRGEVGAGVLMIALGYGFGGLPATLAGLSLAANLMMTGFFIYLVKRLLG